MVLAKLIPVGMVVVAVGCARTELGGPTSDAAHDAAEDATADGSAQDAGVEASDWCDGGPIDSGYIGEVQTCCANKLCYGVCTDAGQCVCGDVLSSCAPERCCTIWDAGCLPYCPRPGT